MTFSDGSVNVKVTSDIPDSMNISKQKDLSHHGMEWGYQFGHMVGSGKDHPRRLVGRDKEIPAFCHFEHDETAQALTHGDSDLTFVDTQEKRNLSLPGKILPNVSS